MKLQLHCVVGLLLTMSVVLSKVINRPRFSEYHLPWACSVVHNQGSLVSSCSIFDANKVIVSVDSFNGSVTIHGQQKKYYEVLSQILVFAGSNLMDPQKLKPWATPEYQVRRAQNLLVPTGRQADGVWEYLTYPGAKELTSSVIFDHYGPALNVGFIVLDGRLFFNAYIQPMPITLNLKSSTNYVTYQIWERSVMPTDTCITYSWSNVSNRMRTHEVTYLYKDDCLELFCSWNLTTCNLFPKQPYQVCFKSVKYADVCPSARGAALFCRNFDHSIFAILTTAPSCGTRGMPGVYTTLPTVISLYEVMFRTKFNAKERPRYEPLGLDQPYSPFG